MYSRAVEIGQAHFLKNPVIFVLEISGPVSPPFDVTLQTFPQIAYLERQSQWKYEYKGQGTKKNKVVCLAFSEAGCCLPINLASIDSELGRPSSSTLTGTVLSRAEAIGITQLGHSQLSSKERWGSRGRVAKEAKTTVFVAQRR